MSTANKPEWPAAELLLSLLGKLLVQNFSNKNVDMSLRVVSLEYLGVVAARLRRDAVSSQLRTDTIDQLLKQVRDDANNADSNDDASSKSSIKKHKKSKKNKNASSAAAAAVDGNQDGLMGQEAAKQDNSPENRIQVLQSLLLDYLAVNSQCDPALLHTRHFYVAQWYMEAASDVSKSHDAPADADSRDKKRSKNNHHHHHNNNNKNSSKKKKKKKRKGSSTSSDSSSDSSSSSSSSSSDDDDDGGDDGEDDGESKRARDPTASNNESAQLTDKRKKFLLARISPFPEAAPGCRTQVLTTPLDGESAELITRFLASKRPFSRSFDSYLKHILKVTRINFSGFPPPRPPQPFN